jgi:hypothetical protein
MKFVVPCNCEQIQISILKFSTLFYIHFGISTFFPRFLAGFYKTLNPNDLYRFTIRRIMGLANDKGPIGELMT